MEVEEAGSVGTSPGMGENLSLRRALQEAMGIPEIESSMAAGSVGDTENDRSRQLATENMERLQRTSTGGIIPSALAPNLTSIRPSAVSMDATSSIIPLAPAPDLTPIRTEPIFGAGASASSVNTPVTRRINGVENRESPQMKRPMHEHHPQDYDAPDTIPYDVEPGRGNPTDTQLGPTSVHNSPQGSSATTAEYDSPLEQPVLPMASIISSAQGPASASSTRPSPCASSSTPSRTRVSEFGKPAAANEKGNPKDTQSRSKEEDEEIAESEEEDPDKKDWLAWQWELENAAPDECNYLAEPPTGLAPMSDGKMPRGLTPTEVKAFPSSVQSAKLQ